MYLKCKHCGDDNFKKLDNNSYECKSCGFIIRKKFAQIKNEESKSVNVIENNESNEENKSVQTTTTDNFSLVKLLLCIFLGQYGVHRFMEGKIATGFIFLFTYGLCGIGCIYDIIRLAREVVAERRMKNR
jgi:ribosomal protein L37E